MKKIENEFIIYYLAFRMKQLGFNEVCFSYYLNGIIQPTLNPKDYTSFEHITGVRLKYFEYVLAPTWQSAFEWFREKYGLYSYIEPVEVEQAVSPIKYDYVILENVDTEELYNNKPYHTYKEAEIACLVKLIEIVESN